jgi:hypothetical protein
VSAKEYFVGLNKCNCISFIINIVLVFKSEQKAGSYLLANANNADNANDTNNTNFAKTLLLTYLN